jgi:hypothetical protein
MMMRDSDRPLIGEEQEQRLREVFPLTMSPEEYAGREGARILMFSLDRYRYQDKHLQAWIRRLGEILSTPGLLAHYQEQYLTSDELEQVRAAEDADDDAWCCLL